jgi:hypothetical protein
VARRVKVRPRVIQFAQRGGHVLADRGDDLCQCSLRGGPVRVVVGGHDALVDAPGGFDFHVPLVGEHCIESLALLVGEQFGAGAQYSADAVERIAGAASVSAGVLLDPLATARICPRFLTDPTSTTASGCTPPSATAPRTKRSTTTEPQQRLHDQQPRICPRFLTHFSSLFKRRKCSVFERRQQFSAVKDCDASRFGRSPTLRKRSSRRFARHRTGRFGYRRGPHRGPPPNKDHARACRSLTCIS